MKLLRRNNTQIKKQKYLSNKIGHENPNNVLQQLHTATVYSSKCTVSLSTISAYSLWYLWQVKETATFQYIIVSRKGVQPKSSCGWIHLVPVLESSCPYHEVIMQNRPCELLLSLLLQHNLAICNNAWFQASAAIQMRSALFWGIMQHRVVIPYRQFRTTYRSHLQQSRRWDW